MDRLSVGGPPHPPPCPAPQLTAVAAVCAGDELLRPLVAVLLLGPQAEAADGDGLSHRLEEFGGGGRGEKVECQSASTA